MNVTLAMVLLDQKRANEFKVLRQLSFSLIVEIHFQ